MSQRHAVTKAIATWYERANKTDKGRILDELCATTSWHRNHARKALGQALRPRIVAPRKPRPPLYGLEVIGALRFCWAVLGAPTGKRLAPVLGELVPVLRRFGVTLTSSALERAIAGGIIGYSSVERPQLENELSVVLCDLSGPSVAGRHCFI